MATENSFGDAFRQSADLSRPLCVSLDGALLTTRLSWERVALLFRTRPWLAPILPLWLLGGGSGFNRRVKSAIDLDAAVLPYRKLLVTELEASRSAGRKVILAAETDGETAASVASHLGLFDAVYSSDEGAPSPKLSEQLTKAFPDGFDYVGNSSADAGSLRASKKGYLVAARSGAVSAARGTPELSVLSRSPSILRALVKELRPHQWAKNALVLAPLVLAPTLPELDTLARGVLAAFTFSLCASAGYVFNDLLDLDADRIHPSKSKRPFASGALPIVLGFPIFVALLVASFALAVAFLPLPFVAMLALYFVGTMTYSLYLKRLLLVDVLVLGGLYTHRILSGGIATQVRISAWLLGFSMFLFTSLAFAKRFVELHAMTSDEKVKNRGYSRVDLPMVTSMGTASGYVAALVFMLYTESSAVRASYREPSLLWLVLPALLYWLGRIWLLAGRGQMQEDPVKFALKDKRSLACVGLIGIIAVTARFTPPWLAPFFH